MYRRSDCVKAAKHRFSSPYPFSPSFLPSFLLASLLVFLSTCLPACLLYHVPFPFSSPSSVPLLSSLSAPLFLPLTTHAPACPHASKHDASRPSRSGLHCGVLRLRMFVLLCCNWLWRLCVAGWCRSLVWCLCVGSWPDVRKEETKN